MKRFLGILLCLGTMVLMVGCGEAKEQSATYVFVQEEAGMYTVTDTQTLYAKGDIVYKQLETTTLEFAELSDATLETLITYYDDMVVAMQASAPTGVEVSSSYEGSIYTMAINLYLEDANLQELVEGGYLMGSDGESAEDFTFISFEKTCAGLEAAGYTLKK